MVLHTLGYVLGAEAALLLLPLITCLLYREDALPFLLTILLLLLISLPLALAVRPRSKAMYAREGFLIVSLSWILVSALGALPFVLDGAIPSYIDALFETVSGFTTTGASILRDIEPLPRGILFWRSFTHWIGGMGVLVFIMAILPLANDRSMHVMRAEVPGPHVGKLVPRARDSALLLYAIYLFLTVAEVIFLVAGGMPLYDSLVNAFGTAGTGGFAVKNASIGFYDSAYVDGVITVFMLLFGINFNLYFLLLLRDFKQVLKSEELRVYMLTAFGSMLLITLNILPLTGGAGSAFRQASFQVSSIMTTTGFATADYTQWPVFSQVILFFLMMLGASGGSTGGGIKVSRVIILFKTWGRELVRLVHPRAVGAVRLDGKRVDDETCRDVSVFFIAYMGIIAVMTLLVSLDGFDFTTTLSSVTACIGNIGPGLGAVGPTGNFADFSILSKLLLSLTMLLGRLEIFPLLLTLTPVLYRTK